ncbi:MAG: DUF58 domain-containing protein [Gemmatimonadaceae bacterium]|jgi:uncharacterized protein (DUF58 family)|nr:DUF58 domain-containing protein [Gemmatimonadaceae bacterium]
MRLTIVPEPRLAAACALAAVPWMLPGRAGLVGGAVAGAAVVLALLVDLVRLPGRRAVRLTRQVPGSAGLGDDVPGLVRLENDSGAPLVATVGDQVVAPLAGGLGTSEVTVPPRGVAEATFRLRATARGLATLGPVGARVRTQLGLVARRLRLDEAAMVDIVPSVAGIGRYRLLALQHRLDVLGIRALRRTGDGLAFAGVREYAQGDDPRRIHWKATARRQKLMVREHVLERAQTMLLLVDAGRNMTQLVGDVPRFEQALSSVLLLTDVAASVGDRVGLLVFDDAVRAWVPPRHGPQALPALRAAMAPVRASLREPDYAGAFRFLAAQQRRRALVVLFTDVIDPRASQALLAHVGRSAARHLPIVVALRNDAMLAAARPALGSRAAALHEAAAAEELLEGREMALAQMRAQGVVVLDVSPSQMTPGVINAYLAIKARGAL